MNGWINVTEIATKNDDFGREMREGKKEVKS